MPPQLRLRLCLLLLVVLGFCLRLYGIETQILWHDEVYTKFFVSGHRASEWKAVLFTGKILDVDDVLAFQRHDPGRGIMATVLGLANDEPQHPPLYYALLRMWIGWFGDKAALRILSALFSVCAIPAMYWFCQELFGSRRVSIYGSVLVTVSPLFVRYAQEAREYSLWSMLILLCCAAFLRAVNSAGNEGARRQKNKWKWWCIFSITAAIALYTSLSTAAVLGAQALFIAVRERGRITRTALTAAAAFTVSGLLFLPWAWLIWKHFESFQASMAWSGQIVVPRHEILTTLALSVSRPFVDFWDELTHPAAVLATTAAVIFLTAVLIHLRHACSHARLLLWLLLGFPVCILLIPDLVFGGIRSVSTRYLMPALLALMAAAAFWCAKQGAGRARTVAGSMLVVLALANCIYNTTRPSWTKGISMSLPAAAQIIHGTRRPLVVGNMERHHPGNLIALCHLLRPGTKLQFLDHGVRYNVPPGYDVFLFSPIPPFLEDLQTRENRKAVLVFEDLHLSLYRIAEQAGGER